MQNQTPTMAVSSLPVLVKSSVDESKHPDWELTYYEEYTDIVFRDNKLDPEIENEINFCEHNSKSSAYRISITRFSFPLLLAIFPEEKKIFVGSARLSRELTLLKWAELYHHYYVDDKSKSLIEDLKEHCEKISSINQNLSPTVIERLSIHRKLPQLWESEFKLVSEDSERRSEQLLQHLNNYKQGIFEKFSDYALGLSASYALIRVHLLKFLAILPSLDHDKSGSEVKRNLLESVRRLIKDSYKARELKLTGQDRTVGASLLVALKITYYTSKLIPAVILTFFVRSIVRQQAKRFIAGENINNISHTIKSLKSSGRELTLDQLGELVVSEQESQEYFEKVMQMIDGLGRYYSAGEKNSAGIYKSHISIKISALCHDFRPYAFDYTYKLVSEKLRDILHNASKKKVFINIDAEHYHYRDLVFEIYKKVLLETKELKSYDQTGIVIQAYLRDAHSHFEEVIELAQLRKLNMPIRLVKGAYWDAETIEAQAHNFKAPQFLNKEETDLHFRQLVHVAFENSEFITLCLASHNFMDHCWARSLRDLKFDKNIKMEHQCLHMTYEALSIGMSKMGWAVRNYIPIGDLLVGMAYLVRRIMENSSQVGVLTIMRSHKKKASYQSPEELFFLKKKNRQLVWDFQDLKIETDFFNASPVRPYIREVRDKLLNVLREYPSNFPIDYSKESSRSGELIEVRSGSDANLIVGKINFATIEDTENSIKTAYEAFENTWWSKDNALLRYSVLLKAGEALLRQRYELASLICYEAGKSLEEALADVDEAVDFINFYTREEIQWSRRFPNSSARGVIAVIPPWNFPLAIPVGMVVSALCVGNSVVLKSSEKSPLIAQKLVDILHTCGVPKNVLIHIPGYGHDVGETLTSSDKIAGIVFTGSKKVGEAIYKKASKFISSTMQRRVVAEMGGKNAIIVTTNCELDETIEGILYSSFAHAGQKCSACSRIIVDERVKKVFLKRFIKAANDLKVGRAFELDTFINPLITDADKVRVQNIAKLATQEAQEYGGVVHLDRTSEEHPGNCVGPAIFELPMDRALKKESIAQSEVFGPIIHLIAYNGLEQAVEIFNSTDYALTGGVFAQSQDDIDYLLENLQAGNLYVNRSNTGARVGIEPFGGFKLSGTGPKAGSADYLKSFYRYESNSALSYSQLLEEGSDYEYNLPWPSRLSLIGRHSRIRNILSDILSRYNSFFPGLSELDKEKVNSLFDWIRDNSDYQSMQHPNHYIPGQLSYNDKYMQKKAGVMFCYCEVPSLRSFMNAISSICMGSGLVILARNKSTYDFWWEISQIFYKHGISKYNLEVYFSSEKVIKKAANDKGFDFYIIDANSETSALAIEQINHSESTNKIKVSLTNFDGPPFYDWEGVVDQFINTRSMAINTMRHGAPLDLNF